MALHLFADAILADKPIQVFNQGHMRRDFTYVDDAVEAIVRVLDRPALPDPTWSATNPDPATSNAPYRLYNVGSHRPVELLELIELLETCLGRRAIRELLPLAPADARHVRRCRTVPRLQFRPTTPIEQGVSQFVDWFRQYYKRS